MVDGADNGPDYCPGCDNPGCRHGGCQGRKPAPDAPELLDMIAKTPNLDRVLALPPERFRSQAAREAFTRRLRDERAGWENAKKERDA